MCTSTYCILSPTGIVYGCMPLIQNILQTGCQRQSFQVSTWRSVCFCLPVERVEQRSFSVFGVLRRTLSIENVNTTENDYLTNTCQQQKSRSAHTHKNAIRENQSIKFCRTPPAFSNTQYSMITKTTSHNILQRCVADIYRYLQIPLPPGWRHREIDEC